MTQSPQQALATVTRRDSAPPLLLTSSTASFEKARANTEQVRPGFEEDAPTESSDAEPPQSCVRDVRTVSVVLHPALDPGCPLEDPPVARPPQMSLMLWMWLAITCA